MSNRSKAMAPSDLSKLIADTEKVNSLSYQEGKGKFSDYVAKLNELVKGKIPADDEVAFERTRGEGGQPAAEIQPDYSAVARQIFALAATYCSIEPCQSRWSGATLSTAAACRLSDSDQCSW